MVDVDGKRYLRLNKELIINATPQGVEIALLEDKKLVELHHEKADASFAVGDLYLGKVKKLIPGLNAAFVDVGFEKDALTSRGDLAVLSVDRISLLARQARLGAEIADKPELAFPDELRANSANPDVAHVLQEEQLQFDSRRSGLAKQVNAVDQNKTYLAGEINALRQKGESLGAELAAMRKEREIIAGLQSRGLSAAPRLLELEQSIAQIEGDQTDVEVAIVRANEDISKDDRDIAGLKAKFRKETLEEAAEVRDKLAETVKKIQTSRNLIQEAEVRAPGIARSNASGYANPIFVLSRPAKDGKMENFTAQETDAIQPGDVLRVTPKNADRAMTAAPRLAD